jgi:hypothetical protein
LEGQDEGPSEVQAIVRAIRVGDAIDPIDTGWDLQFIVRLRVFQDWNRGRIHTQVTTRAIKKRNEHLK